MPLPAVSTVELVASWGSLGEFVPVAAAGSYMCPKAFKNQDVAPAGRAQLKHSNMQVTRHLPKFYFSYLAPSSRATLVFLGLCTLDYHKNLMAFGKHSMCSFAKGVRSRNAFGIELVAKLRDLGLEQCYAGVGSLEAWKTRSENVKVARQQAAM
ncbi:hypothetical protein K438DRAFT_2030489 [Mycena galopus ATCC 62051]|nr:hypothetical protein K438DRAFT_2030489 [Mycena galopus ATCC 62051]